MPLDLNRIEIERIDNLMKNFGWTKTNETITDTEIILTIKKTRPTGVKEYGAGAD